MLSNIVTSNNLQNLSYGYDKFGNLASRKDNLRNLEETFHYDKMNRLTDIYLGNTHSQIVYDPLGRMTDKQADGQTVFANAGFAAAQGQPSRPHAMTSAETVEGVFPSAPQEITYTGFDKVKTIAEGGNTLAYTYGHDQQRIRMVENIGDITRTKDYVGVCEYITEDDGENTTEKTLTYLVGPYGVFAVVEQQDNEEVIHYILKDHLGSWTTITDNEGNVVQELSFDAWGNLRDPETWSGSYSGTPMFDRGFTGHEHMTAFGLINMNGRCYDPLTSSFLSVDAYVQDPTSAQAFNRYAYCGYNPLRYTDPTGWYADGYGRQPQPQSYDPTARYHSDDPNDVLWGRSVHPCVNSSSGYVNGTAVTSTGYTEGNNSSTSRGGVGGFYDQNGDFLGANRYDNGKVYVLRSEIPEVMGMKDDILSFFDGGATTLTWNDIYNCFVEIFPSCFGRNRMYDIVSQDDGNGGSAECNNREYGGYIDECLVMEVPPGDVKSPCVDQKINIKFPTGMEYPTFHSHPSGNCASVVYDDHISTTIFQQSPTPDDYAIAGNHVCYVFGRRDGNVYVYNRKGVQSIITTQDFINPTKFIRP